MAISRYYLDMLRLEWMRGRTEPIELSTEFGLKRPRPFSATLIARLFNYPEHSQEEERLILLGMSSAARVLVVVQCYRDSDSLVRIISARKATRKEVRFYEEGI
jgi:uncharacterized protein